MEVMLMQQNDTFLTIKEVAQILRVSHATVLRLIDDNEIKDVLRVGNQYRIPQKSLDDYLRRAAQ